MLGLSLGLGLGARSGGGALPPITEVARQATILYAPGHNAEALLTGDGTLKTYTTPTLTNVSGKPMTVVSLVNQGWITTSDALTNQSAETPVGNDYPVSGSIRNAAGTEIGVFTWGGSTTGTIENGTNRASDAITLSEPIQPLGTFTIALNGTVANAAKYPPKFGLTGVRTHTTTDGLCPVSMFVFGDSLFANNGGFPILSATNTFPLVLAAVTGNQLARAFGSKFALRQNLLTMLGATVAFSDLSGNDGAINAATNIARVGDIADQIRSAGVSPWWSTRTPQVTTTVAGNYDYANQILSPNLAQRIIFNDEIRNTLALGKLDRYIDFADAVEAGRNSGYWKSGAYSTNATIGSKFMLDRVTNVAASIVLDSARFAADLSNSVAITAGQVIALTGANAGSTRTATASSGVVTVSPAWVVLPSVGDTFSVQIVNGLCQGTNDGVHPNPVATISNQTLGLEQELVLALRNAVIDEIAGAHAIAPRVRATTAIVSGTGDITVTYGVAQFTVASAVEKIYNNILFDGDLLLLLVVNANQIVAPPSGWQLIGQEGLGSAGAVGAARISAFYKRYAEGDAHTVTLTDSGDHTAAVVMTLDNASAATDPIAAFAGSNDNGTTAAMVWPSLSGLPVGTMILAAGADDLDSTAARLSNQSIVTNASTASNFNGGSTGGNGSGLFAFSGAAVGTSISAPTATHTTSAAVKTMLTIAVKGAGG